MMVIDKLQKYSVFQSHSIHSYSCFEQFRCYKINILCHN